VSGRSDEDPAGSWSRTARLTGLAPPETWISPKIEVRVSLVHGNGTFAIAAIAAGEAVQVWGQRWQGSLTAEYTADAGRAALAARRGLMVMQWDEELYSIERAGGDPGYFINHARDPALWFADAFTVHARRPMRPGEEVSLDYALFEADESFRASWECRCGAACCRGLITGRDWRMAELQRRYAGRFTPLLNKRIAALSADRVAATT